MLGAEVGAGFATESHWCCQPCLFHSSLFPSPGKGLAASGSRAHGPLALGPSSLWGSSGKLLASAEPCSPCWGWPGTARGHVAFFARFALGAGEVPSQDSQPYGEALTSGPPAAHCLGAVGSLPGTGSSRCPFANTSFSSLVTLARKTRVPLMARGHPLPAGSISG